MVGLYLNYRKKTMYKKAKETAEFLRSKGINDVKVAVILGTGLGKLADEIDTKVSINYKEIPHFPEATVEFHSGKLIYGKIDGQYTAIGVFTEESLLSSRLSASSWLSSGNYIDLWGQIRINNFGEFR